MNSLPAAVMLPTRIVPSYTEKSRSDSCARRGRLVETLRDDDWVFFLSAPRLAPPKRGVLFLSGGRSGTLRERFARGLPNPAGHVGTVRGSFGLIEAGTSSQETGDRADFSASLLDLFGAGEGIRTLDPDLGKVVLYP
jgi:hypothetical protein